MSRLVWWPFIYCRGISAVEVTMLQLTFSSNNGNFNVHTNTWNMNSIKTLSSFVYEAVENNTTEVEINLCYQGKELWYSSWLNLQLHSYFLCGYLFCRKLRIVSSNLVSHCQTAVFHLSLWWWQKSLVT